MKICIIGTGYVGLTEGVCFADFGHRVKCFDIVKEKIDNLSNGIPTIYENGLKELLKKDLENDNIKFTSSLKDALDDVELIMICVNTPHNPEPGDADLTALKSASRSIAKNIDTSKKYFLVIKSTVPVGTNKMIKKILNEEYPNFKFDIISNPEFSKQGSAIQDFSKPDRIIVGTENDESIKIMEKLYKPITDQGYPIFFCSIETAELIKYASNAFLATKVAFINEMADICEITGANIEEISKAMGMDKRISPYFLKAGPGIGGSCFPKDSMALSKIGKNIGLEMELISSVVSSNIHRKNGLVNRIIKASNTNLKGKTVSMLGLTFKANTDDTRYSPSLNIIEGLAKNGTNIIVYDPQGTEKAKTMLSKNALEHTIFKNNPYDIFDKTELLVISTEWEQFKNLDYKKIYNLLNQKMIIDFRNILNKEEMEKIGFKYICIGK